MLRKRVGGKVLKRTTGEMVLSLMTGEMVLNTTTEEMVLNTTTEETTSSPRTEETLQTRRWRAKTTSSRKRVARLFASPDSRLMETKRSSGEVAFDRCREKTTTSILAADPFACQGSFRETQEATHFLSAHGWGLLSYGKTLACLRAKSDSTPYSAD